MSEKEEIGTRLAFGKELARDAGALGDEYFRSIGDLVIESKGAQDLVSNADLEVERLVRRKLQEQFPDDGIVGEEFDNVDSKSGFTWVIDPIDGTVNFLNSIPAWCVILALVHEDQTKAGIIFVPSHEELFWGQKGEGAFINDKPISVSDTNGLDNGKTGIGMSNRTPHETVTSLISSLAQRGGMIYHNASGGLMLAYVAAGRLIGFVENHMNAWDCLAGQLLISEAGGKVEQQSAEQMLESGGRVVAGAPAVFDALVEIADEAMGA